MVCTRSRVGAEQLPLFVPIEIAGFSEEFEGEGLAAAKVVGDYLAATISPETRSKTPEPTRKLNPTFAAGRGCGAIAVVAARAVTAFRSAYRAALDRWCMGDRDVAFPAGTWWMRVFHSVNIGGSS